ncbi:hypothetical protein ACN4EE_01830 [Geminocystis sp. CENA526]|uniref:hypothetical protein n=1 Tax=Geminocystis sp. CENA526 TaxID=1355871 RepID=UPI003D6DAF31
MGKKSKFLQELKRLEEKQPQSLSHKPFDSSKMSHVLEEFMSPYLHLAKDLDSKTKLFTIGVIAWNASFYAEEERQDITDLLFSQEVIGDDAIIKQELTEIVQQLIDRKLTYFKDIHRLIVDFDLQKWGKFDTLFVTSKLINNEDLEIKD